MTPTVSSCANTTLCGFVDFRENADAAKVQDRQNQRRAATVARYASRRTALRHHPIPIERFEQRSTAQRALAASPATRSMRLRNRDAIDGRPRGHLRKNSGSVCGSAQRPTTDTCPVRPAGR